MRNVNVTVRSGGTVEEFHGVPLPLELGRQRQDDLDWMRLQNLGSHHRIAIAPLRSIAVPREAVRIEEDADGLRLINIHGRSSFFLRPDSHEVKPGQQITGRAASSISLAEDIIVDLESTEAGETSGADQALRTLEGSQQFVPETQEGGRLADLLDGQSEATRIQGAVSLVRQALNVVQKSAGSDEYFQAAVRSAATMIELDRAFVLLYHDGQWRVRAMYSYETDMTVDTSEDSAADTMPRGSGLLRRRVLNTKKTVIYEPSTYMHSTGSSMMALDRAVAAPMLDESGDVMGVLYGDRRFDSTRSNKPIGELEATLLEVIAGAVATGLARQREESLRASMGQFFSPSVTERLQGDDNLLAGRDAEVTVLFCDIRGFSTIAERVGAERTIEWINDVLTELSQCVLETDGVLVDYIGDELMAMWGAPAEQPDHALRACRAARKMLGKRETLKDRWHEITPDRFGFGIGINTGVARVGNTGSKVKFKYGPLGNVVNVASRIQGMTKRFGVSAIVSGATERAAAAAASDADSEIGFRRLADVRPFGVQEIVTVFEIGDGRDADWQSVREAYESALTHFHHSDLTGAARELASLVHSHPQDAPSVQLLGRVVDALTHRDENIDPVVRFDTK
ncbi:adenylate/guanylate cyclase domain-containing protein [Roseiconus nitratireducens]|uniref:Adenylate/guanylate cyclase domain-containing protein n=1 Tax=Roseiconus nitratireducens TaxID=2605748 RepID=A0A5M6DEV0_9BACT|nr:adenylate/guanylate cyclase domain-containing protein [Roseiconus nitratireducens]KAA5543725.1 adenylate/guanylate cyclase domain-containing protein [Roseiconus nitratireducens]